MASVLSYSVAFLWGKCLECFCWMPKLYSLESFWGCFTISVLMSGWGVRPHPSLACLALRAHSAGCRPADEADVWAYRNGAPAASGAGDSSWHLDIAGSGRPPQARRLREPWGQRADSLLLFKRLVHWSSNNVELSPGCFLLRNLGTIGESGRSIYSKVMFRETRLIVED